jgi:hypothetical protein
MIRYTLQICSQFAERLIGRARLVALSDTNPDWWGSVIDGVKVVPPEELKKLSLHKIIISNYYYADDIRAYLTSALGFADEIVDSTVAEIIQLPRRRFLFDCAEIIRSRQLPGSVAEAGVFRGTFAKLINEYFPDRKLWLFDSFAAFNRKELEADKAAGRLQKNYSDKFLQGTSTEAVRSSLPHPEQAVFVKGFFPLSAQGNKALAHEKFAFVNLDFDLYQPTLAGLEFFYGKMVAGGIILVHDYFSWSCRGAGEAVDEWRRKNDVVFTPIGDGMSVATVK